MSHALDEWIGQDSPLWEYVDRAKAIELLAIVRQTNRRTRELGEMLFRLFLADRWLRVFFAGGDDASPAFTQDGRYTTAPCSQMSAPSVAEKV